MSVQLPLLERFLLGEISEKFSLIEKHLYSVRVESGPLDLILFSFTPVYIGITNDMHKVSPNL